MNAGKSPLFLKALALSVSGILGTVTAFIIVSGIEAVIGGQGFSFFSSVWNPNAGHFGILPMIHASVLLAVSSLCVGWLLSLGCCCVMNGLAPKCIAEAMMMILTVMTAMPTVVYGFAAVFLLVPVIREAFGGSGFCWLSAGMILALQSVPTMTLVMDASVRSLSSQTRITAETLGMTPAQHLCRVVLPSSSKALLSSAILGLGRCAGDALLPVMLAGNAVRFASSPLDSMRTLTAHISLVLSSDIGGGEHLSLLLSGALLLAFCGTVSIISGSIIRRRKHEA